MAAGDFAAESSYGSWRDRMRQNTPSYSQQYNPQYSSRYAVDGGYIPQYRDDDDSQPYHDAYAESSSRARDRTQAERAWRHDSPMQYRQDPSYAWEEPSQEESQYRVPTRSLRDQYRAGQEGAYLPEFANDYEMLRQQERNPQTRPQISQYSSSASSEGVSASRRAMNFSRPLRSSVGTSSANTSHRSGLMYDTEEDEMSKRDRQLEERLRRLELKNASRTQSEPQQRTIAQPIPQRPPPPQVSQIPHSAKAYSRPALSPIPSAASSITLSKLGRVREEPEDEDSADDDYHIPDGRRTSSHLGHRANTVQPTESASSSVTSFASQISPVPLTHYPTGTIPLLDEEDNKVDNSFKQAMQKQNPPLDSRPPLPSNGSHEAPIPMHTQNASTSTTRTIDTQPSTAARSSTGDPNSNRTSATSSSQPSSQPSMDVDRITTIPHYNTPIGHPMGNNPAYFNPLMNKHTNSPASGSGPTTGAPSVHSLAMVQPVRTNSTTSSGATSAMEAFRASNYDVSSLTEKQVSKLRKKGIDPALYMEMKAATGGLVGKDGKKRSKWSRALVGNTFIG